MWHNRAFMEDTTSLEQFEGKFRFTFPYAFKEFLFENNGAKATNVRIQTPTGRRTVTALLDFNAGSSHEDRDSAWEVNRRLRGVLTPRRAAFAKVDRHFLCMERTQRQRSLVVWNYLTQKFEPVELSVDEFLALYA